jgi:hypothetical protein
MKFLFRFAAHNTPVDLRLRFSDAGTKREGSCVRAYDLPGFAQVPFTWQHASAGLHHA